MSSNEMQNNASPNQTALIVVAWLWVGIPFLYGFIQLILRVQPLFSQ